MLKFVVALICCFSCVSSFAQRLGYFISIPGRWAALSVHRIVLPQNAPQTLYQTPLWLHPWQQRTLTNQILNGELIPPDAAQVIGDQPLVQLEVLGVPEALRQDIAALRSMIEHLRERADYALATSDPDLSPVSIRPMMRNAAIVLLGAMANIRIEIAALMRVRELPEAEINQELGEAYRLMTGQLVHLQRALNDEQDVAQVIQVVMENREALGYVPPARQPSRPRFWSGLTLFWRGSP